ncbi:hypothetical protein D3C73_807780 [compost metagenome]
MRGVLQDRMQVCIAEQLRVDTRLLAPPAVAFHSLRVVHRQRQARGVHTTQHMLLGEDRFAPGVRGVDEIRGEATGLPNNPGFSRHESPILALHDIPAKLIVTLIADLLVGVTRCIVRREKRRAQAMLRVTGKRVP